MDDFAIRATEMDDYQGLHDVWACPGVLRDTLGLPYASVDKAKKRLEELDPDSHSLVAELDGRIVGNLGLRPRKARMANVGHIGMGVHDDFQDRGIGTALMEAAMDLADNWLNLKRVEPQVYTDNARAIHLYEKFGFEIEVPTAPSPSATASTWTPTPWRG